MYLTVSVPFHIPFRAARFPTPLNFPQCLSVFSLFDVSVNGVPCVAFVPSLGSHRNIPKVMAINSSLPNMPILMELGFCDAINVIASINVSMPHKIG